MISKKLVLTELWRNQKDNETLKIRTTKGKDFVGRFVRAEGSPMELSRGTFRKVDDFEKFTEDETAVTCTEITIDASEIESVEVVNTSRQKSDYIGDYIVK